MKNKENLTIKELCDLEYKDKKLAVPLGWIDDKENVYMDFKNISGLFIGGATGTGKSIFIDDIIVSLMYKNTSDEVKFIMLDPKKIELGEYNGIDYLFNNKNYSDSHKGYDFLIDIMKLLDSRINTLIKTNHRTIEGYNKDSKEHWPHIFIFVDEGCDIIRIKDSFSVFSKILEFGKNCGIHLIYATNSYLKDYSNSKFLDMFKYRMTFDLASEEQEKFIDIKGSSWLKTSGEALIKGPNGIVYKFQAPYVKDDEINEVVLRSKDK